MPTHSLKDLLQQKIKEVEPFPSRDLNWANLVFFGKSDVCRPAYAELADDLLVNLKSRGDSSITSSRAWITSMTHIAITEEIFATERLAPQKEAHWKELWPRFRGGSTPDEDVPTVAMIREVLNGAREHLLETLRAIGDGRLDEIPEALRERKFTVRDVFFVIAWHEAHHQGQAHLTFNLYKASRQKFFVS